MKRTLVALLLAGAAVAPAALNAYRTSINLPAAVKLPGGTILPAGRYEVDIEYRGWGNAATLNFLQGGVPKGKAPAEARGFASQAPGTVGYVDPFAKLGDIKGESIDDKHRVEAVPPKKVIPPEEDASKAFDKYPANEKWQKVQPGDALTFNWGRAGFPSVARPGVARALGDGSVKLSFDSTNSAAGFNAILPFIEKGQRK